MLADGEVARRPLKLQQAVPIKGPERINADGLRRALFLCALRRRIRGRR
jgi:hypothetical protein